MNRHVLRLPFKPRRLFHGMPHAERFHTLLRALRLGSTTTIDPTTLALAVKASSHTLHPHSGPHLHAVAISSGLSSNVLLSNSLINMYSKSGRIAESLRVFHAMPMADVVSWNTILSGSGHNALAIAARMHQLSVQFDHVTFTTVLASASDAQDAQIVPQLHTYLVKLGFHSDTVVGNALITAYMRSSVLLDYACKVFDEMPERDMVSWNALISGWVQDGNFMWEAIRKFVEMKREFPMLDHVSISSVITASGHERELVFGKQIHGLAVKVGIESHVLVSNVLVSMYAKCGAARCGRRVFDGIVNRDVISWTTMIAADVEEAPLLFQQMRADGVYPNEVTFVGLIHALSTSKSSVCQVQMVHGLCYRMGFLSQPNISNSLVSAYAKVGSVDDAKKVFDEMDHRELLSWNALITGYSQNDMCEDALATFSSLLLHLKPDQFTFGSLVSVISRAETVPLAYGHCCHCRAIKVGLESDEHVLGALIDMYAKRGSITDSKKLFDGAQSKTLITWTSMISSYAVHGDYEVVTRLFKEMIDWGIHPDHMAFLAVLTACGRRGMVEQGLEIFESMHSEHGVEPWREHYASVVDMLARAGRLDEAEAFIRRMPMDPGVSALQSLLGACRVRGNAEMGKKIANALLEIEPTEAGTYILLANIYAERGEWEEVARIRKEMRAIGVRKEVGFSWVDLGGEGALHMHCFSSEDASHQRAGEIYEMAWCLGLGMRSLVGDSSDINSLHG